jgi:hypothetical protein
VLAARIKLRITGETLIGYLNYGNGNEAYSLEATIIGGSYNGYCIGDDDNSSGNASAGLVPC